MKQELGNDVVVLVGLVYVQVITTHGPPSRVEGRTVRGASRSGISVKEIKLSDLCSRGYPPAVPVAFGVLGVGAAGGTEVAA